MSLARRLRPGLPELRLWEKPHHKLPHKCNMLPQTLYIVVSIWHSKRQCNKPPVPMSWGAVAQPSVAPLGNPAGQPTMVMAPQSIPQQAAAPQTVPQQASLPAMQIPPQIPPQLPTPVVKSGSIYRDLMKKHDRFTQRHLEPAVTYE